MLPNVGLFRKVESIFDLLRSLSSQVGVQRFLLDYDMVEKIVILSIDKFWNRVSKAFLSNEPIELLDDGARVLCKAHSKVSLGFLQLAGYAWNTLVISIRGVSLQGTM